MDEKLQIQLLKIVKQSKQLILDAFDDDFSRTYYVDFDSILEDVEKHTKSLANSLNKEASSFNCSYANEEEMLEYIKNSFENINFEVKELISIYKKIKSEISDDNIQALLSFQISKKILYDYIIWCEKLENAILDINEDEVIFIPNIEIENSIINFVVNNTKSNELNYWFPFLGGIGLGFLLDGD